MAQLWKSGAGASRHDYIFETLKGRLQTQNAAWAIPSWMSCVLLLAELVRTSCPRAIPRFRAVAES